MTFVSRFLTHDPEVFLLSGPEVSARDVVLGEVRKPSLGKPALVELAWTSGEPGKAPKVDVTFHPISEAREARGDRIDATLTISPSGEMVGKGVLDVRLPFLPAAIGDREFGTVFALTTRCDRPEVVSGAELCVIDGQRLVHAWRMPAGEVSHLAAATRLMSALVEPALVLRLFLQPFQGPVRLRMARAFVGQDYDPFLFNPFFERMVAVRSAVDRGMEAEAKAEFLRDAQDAMSRHDYRGGQCFLKPFVVIRSPDPEFPLLLGTPNSLAWYGQGPTHNSAFYHREGLVRPGATVLDCGAHAGELSMLFAKTVGPQGRVIAFDPFPQNSLQVKAQALLNGTPWLEAVEAGVGAGKATIPTELELQMTTGSTAPSPTRSMFPLQIIPLDDYIDSAPSFIKIDVEGAEAQCLAGAQQVLRRHRPYLYVEVHPLFLQKFGQSVAEFFELIPKDLYSILYRLDDSPPGWHQYEPSVAARFEGKVGGYVRAVPV
jgi:FkbM family methyltransferase